MKDIFLQEEFAFALSKAKWLGQSCGIIGYANTCNSMSQALGSNSTALCLIQCPANVPGKAADGGPSAWAPASRVGA